MPLLSPRTQSYVDNMIRDGDNFDYAAWLRRVREEEAKASERLEPQKRTNERQRCVDASLEVTRDSRDIRKRVGSLRQRLLLAVDAWDDFQTSRSRDAIYPYLEVIYTIVLHYDGRRQRRKLLRRAGRFSGCHLSAKADVFTTAIRSTSGGELNTKSISKMARALRFVAHKRRPRRELITFMKAAGGVNACAAKYARLRRTGRAV